jgi:hypothetical protein
MAEILIPVGHDLGAVYARPGDALPSSFDLRAGDGAFILSAPEYLLWQLSFGQLDDPEVDDGIGRGKLLDIAAELELEDATTSLNSLTAVGALTGFDPGDPEDVTRFASSHRIVPLTTGAGNVQAAPWSFRVPTVVETEVILTGGAFQLWSYSHLTPNLLAGAEHLAAEGAKAHAEATAPGGVAEGADLPEPPSATALIDELLLALPQLLAGRAVYVDRSI